MASLNRIKLPNGDYVDIKDDNAAFRQNSSYSGSAYNKAGSSNNVNNIGALALGTTSVATGKHAVSEGYYTLAEGDYSHSEGNAAFVNNFDIEFSAYATTTSDNDSSGVIEFEDAADFNEWISILGGDPQYAVDQNIYFYNVHTYDSFVEAYAHHDLYSATVTSVPQSYDNILVDFTDRQFPYTDLPVHCGTGDGIVVYGPYGASGNSSHTEGNNTTASGSSSHAEGYYTMATGERSHAEGSNTTASGNSSHAEGSNNAASNFYSHAEGNTTTASGTSSHAEGSNTTASGNSSHAEGYVTIAYGSYSHAEGYNTETGGNATTNTKSAGSSSLSGSFAHAEGNATIAQGKASHAEGVLTFAVDVASHAEGYYTMAAGAYSHVEGSNTTASGASSHAEGSNTIASSPASHAEGSNTTSSGQMSHAEGDSTVSLGLASHAEGRRTQSNSSGSHAEGLDSSTGTAAHYSHAEGGSTQTTNWYEHAEGTYNLSTTNTTLHSVGIGTSSARKNAHEITTDGKHYILGVGGYDGTNVTASGVQDLATVINSSGSNGLVIHEVSDSGSTTAGTWLASNSEITALTDGLTIRYKLVVAGAATTTLNLNNLGAKTVYRFNSTKLTTHYAVHSYIILTYNSSLNSGCWITVDGYDSNSDNYVRQYVASGNAEYSLLARYATASVSSYEANYARFADGVTVNPSTDTITASGFKITGGTSSQVLTADGSTRSITISSSEPTTGTGSDGDIWIVI